MQNTLVNLNKHAYGNKEKDTDDHTVENSYILQGEWTMVFGMRGMGGIDDERVSQDSHLQERGGKGDEVQRGAGLKQSAGRPHQAS
jgi:hypothetical protein